MNTHGWYGRTSRRRLCVQPYRWSTLRGGCRFERGHGGPCKPGRYR